MGAPYVELDVHMTSDGQVVVSHDGNLSRMCGEDRAIREMSFAQLARADAGRMFTVDGTTFPFRGTGLTVPRLAEVFAAISGVRVLIEVKQTAPSVVAAMLEVIDRASMRASVLVASEHQQPLDEIRQLAPAIPTNLSTFECGEFFQALAARNSNYSPPGAALQIPREYETWQLVTSQSVEFAHRVGLEVHVWTVNEETAMTELLDLGVDGIVSDFPARLLDVIARRAPRAS